MQNEIGDQIGISVGLRKLNEVVHGIQIPHGIELTSVPPVVLLDAIWVTLLEDTGEARPDTKQRQRSVTARRPVCVLVALGLYPQTGRWAFWDGISLRMKVKRYGKPSYSRLKIVDSSTQRSRVIYS